MLTSSCRAIAPEMSTTHSTFPLSRYLPWPTAWGRCELSDKSGNKSGLVAYYNIRTNSTTGYYQCHRSLCIEVTCCTHNHLKFRHKEVANSDQDWLLRYCKVTDWTHWQTSERLTQGFHKSCQTISGVDCYNNKEITNSISIIFHNHSVYCRLRDKAQETTQKVTQSSIIIIIIIQLLKWMKLNYWFSKAIFGGSIFPTIIPEHKFEIYSGSLMFQ